MLSNNMGSYQKLKKTYMTNWDQLPDSQNQSANPQIKSQQDRGKKKQVRD